VTVDSESNYPGDAILREYLLGGLTAEERDQIASKLLESETLVERMKQAEIDLLDEYARQELPVVDRVRLEQRAAANPDQQLQLRLAQALQRRARRGPARWWGAIAASIIVLFSAGLWWSLPRLRESKEQVGTTTAPAFVATIVASATRDAARAQVIQIPPDASEVELRFTTEEQLAGPVYGLVLRDTRGGTVFEQERRTVAAGALAVKLPATLLQAGNYEAELRLRGAGAVQYYYFRVAR
jgi:anti-sigma-K factor RskA